MRFNIYVRHVRIHYLPFRLLKALNKNLPSPTIFFFVVEHKFSNTWPITIVFGGEI